MLVRITHRKIVDQDVTYNVHEYGTHNARLNRAEFKPVYCTTNGELTLVVAENEPWLTKGVTESLILVIGLKLVNNKLDKRSIQGLKPLAERSNYYHITLPQLKSLSLM